MFTSLSIEVFFNQRKLGLKVEELGTRRQHQINSLPKQRRHLVVSQLVSNIQRNRELFVYLQLGELGPGKEQSSVRLLFGNHLLDEEVILGW